MNGTRIIGALAATIVVVAACGGDDSDDAAPDASPSATETPVDDQDAAETAPPEEATEPPSDETEPPAQETDVPAEEGDDADVQVDSSSSVGIAETSLGTILVDSDGKTLYIFDSDDQGASTCYGDCAANWPPLTVDGDPVAGESVDTALLGTAERDDGSAQVTYDGWPLYRWMQDGAPGAVNGQGVNGTWWVTGPDGTPIRE
jgi:predicted lipoprotein with Yx(FWY)xxD motif